MSERSPSAAKERAAWEKAYDEAMQWRDWQTCETLIDEREQADWYTPGIADDHAERGFKLHNTFAALRKAPRGR